MRSRTFGVPGEQEQKAHAEGVGGEDVEGDGGEDVEGDDGEESDDSCSWMSEFEAEYDGAGKIAVKLVFSENRSHTM